MKIDWNEATEQRLNWFNELDEFHLKAYESSALYREKMKKYHEQNIEKHEFGLGTGPFFITKVFPHGAGELKNKMGVKFMVNVS